MSARLAATLGLTALLVGAPGAVTLEELLDLVFTQTAYENAIYTATPAGPAPRTTTVVTPHSGSLHARPAGSIPAETPSNAAGTVALVESSIGWSTPASLGWEDPTFAPGSAVDYHVAQGQEVIDDLQAIFDGLYSNTGTSDPDDPEQVYLDLMLNPDGSPSRTVDQLTSPELEAQAITNFFIAHILDGLNPEARAGLLDVPYFRSVGLIMAGNLELERAYSVRLFELIANNPELGGGLTIEKELAALGWDGDSLVRDLSDGVGAWRHFDEAAALWLRVLANPFLREIMVEDEPTRSFVQGGVFAEVDPPTNLPPGQTWPPTVYDGYKDLGAAMRALAQRARTVDEISERLLLLAGSSVARRQEVADLIGETTRDIALQEGILFSLFFPEGLPADHGETYPGLAESFALLRDSLESMRLTRAIALNTRVNALGFDNQLTLVLPGQSLIDPPNNFITTFDYMFSVLESPSSPVTRAVNRDSDARDSREQFNADAGAYLDQFGDLQDEYEEQLLVLVGTDPDTGGLALNDPAGGVGGEISQQIFNIQVADNDIRRVQTRMGNVQARIDIELERVARVNGILDRKAEMIINDGERTLNLSEEIDEINAQVEEIEEAREMADNAIDDIINPDPKEIIAGSIRTLAHIGVSFIGAEAQAELEDLAAEKEREIQRIQFMQEARNIQFEAAINDIESEARVRTWVLELKVLEIDLLNARLTHAREIDRLNGLFQRLDQALIRQDRAERRLTRRSFSDPIYRIEILDAALRAQDSFSVAQDWMYLTARALEYKYATLFTAPEESTGDQADLIPDILAARTGDDLAGEQVDMGFLDGSLLSRLDTNYFYWNYSLRREALRMVVDITDPDTMQQVTPVEQFRAYLADLLADPANLVDTDGNGVADHLGIPFSTVNFRLEDTNPSSTPLESDIAGGTVQAEGVPIFDPQLWNDKIDWVQVNVLGNNVYAPGGTPSNLMSISLFYGGSAFLQTRSPLTVDGRSLNYLTIPVVRALIEPSARRINVETEEFVQVRMQARVGTGPNEAPQYTLRTNNLREWPVAATDWRVLIPLDGTNFQNIEDIEIIIVHRASTRPI